MAMNLGLSKVTTENLTVSLVKQSLLVDPQVSGGFLQTVTKTTINMKYKTYTKGILQISMQR